MLLNQILQSKGSAVHSIGPDDSLSQVVQKLVACNCGSLLVCDNEEIVGIITERDILRACATHEGHLSELRVRDRMSSPVVTALPQDRVSDVMGLLTSKRIRHLPVVDEEGNLVGMISIGDVVKAQHDQLSVENHYLKQYIRS
jgi:CBS domain-containing protein